MTTRWIFALSVALVFGTAAAYAEDDCLFGPGGAGAEGVHGALEGKAYVHRIEYDGCKPQCIGRVFCKSEHPKAAAQREIWEGQMQALWAAKVKEDHDNLVAGKIPFAVGPANTQFHKAEVSADAVLLKGELYACDAETSSSATGPLCPDAKSCKLHGTKLTSVDAPNVPDDKSYYFRGDNVHANYGLGYSSPLQQIPRVNLPPKDGNDAKACTVCASAASINEAVFDFAVCQAKADGSCRTANECLPWKHNKSVDQKVSGRKMRVSALRPEQYGSRPDPLVTDPDKKMTAPAATTR